MLENGHWWEYKDKKGNYIAPAVTFGGCQNRRKSNKCESQYEFLVTVEPCLQSCRYACATVIGNFSPNIFTGLKIFSHFGNSHCRSHRRRRRLRIITVVCNSRCYPILFLTLVVEGCPPRIIACIRFNVLHLSLRPQTGLFLTLVVGGCQPRIIIACIRFNALHLSLRIETRRLPCGILFSILWKSLQCLLLLTISVSISTAFTWLTWLWLPVSASVSVPVAGCVFCRRWLRCVKVPFETGANVAGLHSGYNFGETV